MGRATRLARRSVHRYLFDPLPISHHTSINISKIIRLERRSCTHVYFLLSSLLCSSRRSGRFLVKSQGCQSMIYAFNSRREGSLTCRHWLLDPTGCQNNQCRYTHKITGTISPPSMFACYAFNNGGYRHRRHQCLFAHLITGHESTVLADPP